MTSGDVSLHKQRESYARKEVMI